jgi:ribose 5-phosphate isomerase A
VVASSATEARATAAGFQIVSLDDTVALNVAVDGADQIDHGLNLIRGHGAALLREKLVVAAAERFIVIAERAKLVDRLGEGSLLPVEVVGFGWAQTRRRLLDIVPEATLRLGDDRAPLITDENHYLLDCTVPAGCDLVELSGNIEATLGVVEHGLFLGMADEAFLGTLEGRVETLSRQVGPAPCSE